MFAQNVKTADLFVRFGFFVAVVVAGGCIHVMRSFFGGVTTGGRRRRTFFERGFEWRGGGCFRHFNTISSVSGDDDIV